MPYEDGPNSPSSGTQINTGSGTITWNLQSNITASENAYSSAQALIMGGESHLLTSQGHGFAIVAEATIVGIKLEIERSTGSGTMTDLSVFLTKDGTATVGDDKGDTGTNWPASDEYASYGGPADLWGTTWTPAEVNAATFGGCVSTTLDSGEIGRVDHMRITVYYGRVDVDTGSYDISSRARPMPRWSTVEAVAGF